MKNTNEPKKLKVCFLGDKLTGKTTSMNLYIESSNDKNVVIKESKISKRLLRHIQKIREGNQ